MINQIDRFKLSSKKVFAELISNYILGNEDYPRMQELLDRFLRTHYNGSIDLENAEKFLKALLELLGEGKIIYDDKHDAWLYTGVNNPKLQELIDNSVRVF